MFVAVDQELAGLRSDPRFDALTAKLGLAQVFDR
jgi:hypothetical protein